jgi:hypothetical protein
MPQVWMTYGELATLCGCTASEARLRAGNLSLHRRKCSDGATRVKLNLLLMARFFVNIRESDFDLDGAIEAVRETHRSMAELLTPEEAGNKRRVA